MPCSPVEVQWHCGGVLKPELAIGGPPVSKEGLCLSIRHIQLLVSSNSLWEVESLGRHVTLDFRAQQTGP